MRTIFLTSCFGYRSIKFGNCVAFRWKNTFISYSIWYLINDISQKAYRVPLKILLTFIFIMNICNNCACLNNHLRSVSYNNHALTLCQFLSVCITDRTYINGDFPNKNNAFVWHSDLSRFSIFELSTFTKRTS